MPDIVTNPRTNKHKLWSYAFSRMMKIWKNHGLYSIAKIVKSWTCVGTITSMKKNSDENLKKPMGYMIIPLFWKEREIIIEVCHALPGGIQL